MNDFETTLRNMLKDINEYKRDRAGLLEYYIQTRLNLSLENYYKDLMHDYNNIMNRSTKKMLRNLNKEEDN